MGLPVEKKVCIVNAYNFKKNVDNSRYRNGAQIWLNLNSDLAIIWLNLNSDFAIFWMRYITKSELRFNHILDAMEPKYSIISHVIVEDIHVLPITTSVFLKIKDLKVLLKMIQMLKLMKLFQMVKIFF